MMLLDYSAGKISGAAIRAAGYGGAIRYITDSGNLGTKHTSASEYRDHIACGLQDWLVYEVNTDDPLGGRSGGITAAQRALDGANYIGYPADRHIFFCFDRHASTSELPAWRTYLDGAASVLGVGRVGAYGFSEAIDAAQGHATAFWQCGSRSAVRSFTNFYQRNTGTTAVGGISCDINDVLIPLEYDVALTDDDAKLIAKHIWYDPIWSGLNPDGVTRWQMNPSQVLDALNRANQAEAAKVDALISTVAKLSTNPALTVDAVRQIVTDAVKQNLSITGEVHIGPAA
jgi:hypothetical protein